MNYRVEYKTGRNQFDRTIIERTERRIYDDGSVQEMTDSISPEGVRQVAALGKLTAMYREQALAELPAGGRCPDGLLWRDHTFEANDYCFDWSAADRGEEEPVFSLIGWDCPWFCIYDEFWTPSLGWHK